MKKSTSPSNSRTKGKRSDADPLEHLKHLAKYDSITKSVFGIVDSLSAEAAEGNSTAFYSLVKCSIKIAMTVRELTDKDFDTARKLARHVGFWPTLLTPSPNFFRQDNAFIKKLELGAEFSMPIDIERTFRETTIPRKIAVFLIQLTQSLRKITESLLEAEEMKESMKIWSKDSTEVGKEMYHQATLLAEDAIAKCELYVERYKGYFGLLVNVLEISCDPDQLDRAFAGKAYLLSPLESNSVDEWVEFGKEIILSLTDRSPENNPVLRKIGLYRKDAYYRKDTTNVTFEERRKMAKQTEDANIRDGIFTRIKSAYPKVIKKAANDGGTR